MPIKTRPRQREVGVASGLRRARKLSLHRETIGRLANDGPEVGGGPGRNHTFTCGCHSKDYCTATCYTKHC